MSDIFKFSDDISDEMLAAYIDGNATESESELIENALSSDELLIEAQEVANDINSFMTDDDWIKIEDVPTSMEIPIGFPNDDHMVAAILEPCAIGNDSPSLNISSLDDELPTQIDNFSWDNDDIDL